MDMEMEITIFSGIFDAKLFPPMTAALVHNVCPLKNKNKKQY